MDRPSAEQIRTAVKEAGLKLTDDEIKDLAAQKTIPLIQDKIRPLGGCSGIKLVDLGHGCGLYLNPFPPSVNVCCQT